MNLDSIDVRILEELQRNARISISEMSKRVNLSLSAISERLKKLENSGIIDQYTAILNPVVLNKQLAATMLVSLEDPSRSEEFISFVNSNPEILECFYITGEYDYSIKIVTSSTSELETILNKVKGVSSIKRTQTNVVLKTIKQCHSVSATANKLS